jgi:hypothetical protein
MCEKRKSKGDQGAVVVGEENLQIIECDRGKETDREREERENF